MVMRVLCLLFLALAPAALADEAPTLADWLKKDRKETGAFPHAIAFVTGFGEAGEEPQFLDLPEADFARASYMRPADTKSALWNMKLNKDKYAEMDPKELVFALTGADTVLVASSKGEWELLRKDGKKIESVLKKKKPKKVTPTAVAEWLVSGLGWDGVVLDRSTDYLLVGSTATILKTPEIQALAVSDSQEKLKLTESERMGAGLLSLSESDGGVGVFDVVFLGQGVKAIPIGTKLIIEKKKRVPKP
jgi:hypothetical protein